jgi:hypothetical protein
MSSSLQSYIDDNKNMLYILHINNYQISNILMQEKYIMTHMHLIKTGIKNSCEIFTGLTSEGIKTMTVLEWCKYMKLTYKKWIDDQIEIFNKIDKKLDEDFDLALISKKDDTLKKYMRSYESINNFKKLKNYFDVGCFDIFEFINSLTKIIINTNNNIIVDLT